MRLLQLFIFSLLSASLLAQADDAVSKAAFTIRFETDAVKGFKVMQFNGFNFEELAAVPVMDSFARVEVELNSVRFFYVGTNTRDMKPIVLKPGIEERFLLNQKSFRALRYDVSSFNGQYAAATKDLRAINKKRNSMVQKWHGVRTDASKVASIEEIFQRIEEDEKMLRDSFAAIDPFYGVCYDLMTYPMFQVDPGDFENELLHYVNRRFEGIDFNDPNVYNNSWLYEAYKEFAELVSSYTLTPEDNEKAILSQVYRAENPKARILAFGGALAGLEAKKHGNYSVIAQLFLDEFENTSPGIRSMLETKIKRMDAYRIGGDALPFTQNTPEGEALSLEDYRGKVVLLDFWASWCGPCRRENPNVVKVYEKYKDQGFEIIGISLDKDQKRWVDAIAKDQLTWPQVSDLKGWQNEVGQMYGVSSIPHTVLLDEEGKIIALKLRGPALEQKLESIFSEKNK